MPAADIHMYCMCHYLSHLLREKQAGQSLGTEHRLSSLWAADQCICTDKGWSCLLIHSASSLSLVIMEMREWPFPEVSEWKGDCLTAFGGMNAVQGTEAALQRWLEGLLWVKTDLKHCATFTAYHHSDIYMWNLLQDTLTPLCPLCFQAIGKRHIQIPFSGAG